jgi:Putative Flp pilus-assembly TadE/G-like
MSQATGIPTKRAIAPPKGDGKNPTFLCRVLGEESGQVLPWVAVVMLAVLGIAALSVDLGRAMVIRRQLQMQADLAALAAVENISDADFSTYGQNYSGAGVNSASGINVGTPQITGLCLSTVSGAGWNIPCNSLGYNAVQVTETATVPTLFARLLGRPTLTISATSTASPGRPIPYNVALILDTTPSMTTQDKSCSNKTQLECAVEGIQGLLKGLYPSMDRVSLFTFPNLYTTDVSNEYNCAGTDDLTVPPYTFPYATATTLTTMPFYTYTTYTTGYGNNKVTHTQQNEQDATYQIVDYSNDYKTSDTATTLNTKSNLVKAVGGKSGCSSMGTGEENTYYAGAIYAAQASLVAEQKANPGTLNAIILLSDGNATAKENNPNGDFRAGYNDMVTGNQSTNVATSSGSYASWYGQCSQAVDAADAASKAGTTVYTIAYGALTTSSSGNCGGDRHAGVSHYGITPCQTMQDMSTGYTSGTTKHFFSDTNYGSSGCQASGANSGTTAIADIYQLIRADLQGARLIPNGTP